MSANVSASLTIAHLSDLHLSLERGPQNVKRVCRLLEHVLRTNVNHVVVTGDLTADARPKELKLARRIFKGYGLLDPTRLSVVPGNHDIFGGVHTAEDILGFPKRCKRTDYAQMLDMFVEAFAETFAGTITACADKPFPYVKLLDGAVLVGINSVAKYSRVNNPFGSNGEVGNAQFERLKELLADESVPRVNRIALIHHHFSQLQRGRGGAMHSIWSSIEKRTLKLHRKRRLFTLFARERIDLVLHGHVHENCEYERNGIRFANAGASVLTGRADLLGFTLVRCSRSRIDTMHRSVDPNVRRGVVPPVLSSPPPGRLRLLETSTQGKNAITLP